MGLDLKHLRCFVAVAEDLNFSAAARRLHMSQQALSRIVQQLERGLGVQLLERTTRSTRLTPAGKALLDSGRRSLTAIDAAFEAARRAAGRAESARLTLDVSSSGLHTGAEILRGMRRSHPEIALVQVEHGVPRGLGALLESRLDALIGLEVETPAGVHAEPVRHEAVVVGMAPDHPLAALDVVPVAELAECELLLPSSDAAPEWVRFVQEFCRQAGGTARPWPEISHGSVGAAEIVRAGGCVVPTTAWAAPPTDLAFRPLVDPTPVCTWSMMVARDALERPEVAALVECVRALSAELGWLSKT